jgi:hypothetical protein
MDLKADVGGAAIIKNNELLSPGLHILGTSLYSVQAQGQSLSPYWQ